MRESTDPSLQPVLIGSYGKNMTVQKIPSKIDASSY